MNGRDLTLGALAGLAVAGLVAQRRRGGLNRVARVMAPLWIGTTRRNLPGILAHGIIPSGGYSEHRTKTKGAVFLAGDPEAALLYADARRGSTRANSPNDPVLLKVDVRGLALLPDYDDLAADIQAYLMELSEEVGEDVEPGVPLGDLEDAVYDAIETIEERRERGGIRAEIEDEGDERVLALIPIHDLSINTRAYRSDPDLYEGMTWDEDGDPRFETTQYQYLGTIPVQRIDGIYLLERTARKPDLTLPSYGHLVWPRTYPTLQDALNADADVQFLKRKFHRYSVQDAKRLRFTS